MRVVLTILASQLTDILTAFTFSAPELVPAWLNTLLTTVYYLCSFASAIAFERYGQTVKAIEAAFPPEGPAAPSEEVLEFLPDEEEPKTKG